MKNKSYVNNIAVLYKDINYILYKIKTRGIQEDSLDMAELAHFQKVYAKNKYVHVNFIC